MVSTQTLAKLAVQVTCWRSFAQEQHSKNGYVHHSPSTVGLWVGRRARHNVLATTSLSEQAVVPGLTKLEHAACLRELQRQSGSERALRRPVEAREATSRVSWWGSGRGGLEPLGT